MHNAVVPKLRQCRGYISPDHGNRVRCERAADEAFIKGLTVNVLPSDVAKCPAAKGQVTGLYEAGQGRMADSPHCSDFPCYACVLAFRVVDLQGNIIA